MQVQVQLQVHEVYDDTFGVVDPGLSVLFSAVALVAVLRHDCSAAGAGAGAGAGVVPGARSP